jgi:protein associated with RNAse G/E
MFHLPELKSLSFRGLWNLQEHEVDLELAINKNIKKLIFVDFEVDLKVMKSLITAIPNLENLQLYSMNQKSMELISKEAKNLKILKLRTIDASDFTSPDLFSKLEEVDIDCILTDTEDEMKKIPREKRNPFVKAFLKSCYDVLD